MSLQSLKNKTRKEVAARLRALDVAQVTAQSAATAAALARFPPFQSARSVGVYMHLPENELHTDAILDSCFRTGKTVFLPRIEQLHVFDEQPAFPGQKSCLHFLSVQSRAEADALPPRGKYQIREPDYAPDRSNDLLAGSDPLDLLLLPGVAFTATGRRLGHGAGFYDDFIKRYRAKHGTVPLLVGIGLPDQLVKDPSSLQLEPHDEPLDYVILGGSVFSAASSLPEI
ncbi:hypothetical protein PICMEDRAFT_111098 [Pichia membranifaciens NRRL Y-2026]|uniref:5-formyltetrahydrofolate cyclo-ligase n=1 Tax=Pichia membranifaciens NRRL Y-2026 TaxID=763406 RepID=A0A1E3NMF0_9ASCO|nr:hypothetical protein PICMEDRAFT_111098 [Pichia membranifaciens NRRL Y-2026]ODQ47312.1 hypothetical protein PICMEDRAFT_111098 [Pichia membranifaciens NRRL Y-2026]